MQSVIQTEPIEEVRGDDWQRIFRLKGASGAPYDLTGCAIDDVAINWSGGTLPLTCANGRLSVNAGAGEVTVKISRDDNPQIPDGERSRLVLTLVDTLGCKSTLMIVPIRVIVP